MSEYDDERVQQVIEALDPTPASEVEWPVSRRQTLRALAAAGLLGAGSGSASGESVGGVIADEANLANYDSESVSDGWELTIDDDVFGLTASEETIDLPDGRIGSELVTPSGGEAREFVAPDGTVVFEGDAIPDSEDLHARYDWAEEDGSLPVSDQTGNNNDLDTGGYSGVNADINGVQAGEFDAVDDYVSGNSSTQSQPNSLYFVVSSLDLTTSDFDPYLFDGAAIGDANSHEISIDETTGEVIFGDLIGGDVSTGGHIISVIADGSNSVLRVDGTQVASGSGQSGSIEDITFFTTADDRNARRLGGSYGESLIYPDGDTTRISDVEQYLSDKWGISI